jgi:hypothetical protein
MIQPADVLSANAQLQPSGRVLWYTDSGAHSTTQFTVNYESETAQNQFAGGRTYKLFYWVM